MRVRKPFLMALLVAVAVALALGCSPEPAPVEKHLDVLRNDLDGGRLQIIHDLEGEDFKFITSYDTDYDTARWRVTDSKTLHMRAWVEPLVGGEDMEVLVEHVHIDLALKSKYAMLDGWSLDSMDDRLHVGSQPGFLITSKWFYENVFAIEGFSQTLIEGWGYWTDAYGYSRVGEYRLTEDNLVKKGGVYANKFQVVYDLLIRYPGEKFYHTRSVIDEFLVPVAGGKQVLEATPTGNE